VIVVIMTLLLAFGWALSRRFDRDARGVRRMAEAFLFGWAGAALSLWLLSAIHVPWSVTALVIVLLVATAIAVVRLPARSANASDERSHRSRNALLIDAAVLLLIILHLAISCCEGPYEFDYFGIWGFKGHLFHEAKSIDWATLTNLRFFWIQSGHPLFVPLFYDVATIAQPAWSDRSLGVLTPLFGVATILFVRGLTREEHDRDATAALITLAVAPLALSLWIGLAEGFLIAFATSGLLMMRRGVQRLSRSDLRTGAFFLGCAAMTKNEGTAFLLAAALALLLSHRRGWRDLGALWPALVVMAPWLIARKLFHIGADFMQGDALSRLLTNLQHPGAILEAIAAAQFDDRWFWLAVVLTILFAANEVWRRERFLFLALLIQFSLYVAQNFIVPWDAAVHVRFSWGRLIEQMAPAAAFLVATLLLSAPREERHDPEPATP
jgi:hypothetical protein